MKNGLKMMTVAAFIKAYAPKPAQATVEIVEGELPRLHIEWYTKVLFEVENAKERTALKKANFRTCEGFGKQLYVVGYAKQPQHLWFCNFRRYGWCATEEAAGTEGYDGFIYANGRSPFSVGGNREAVIRDSLIFEWGMLCAWKRRDMELASLLESEAAHDALALLLEDAIQNASAHAGILYVHYSCSDVPLTRR